MYKLFRAAILLMAAVTIARLPLRVNTAALAAIGADGTAPSPAQSDAGSARTYAASLDHHMAWASFPMRVFFDHDAAYTVERERATLAGFNAWTRATHGYVCFTVVEEPDEGGITVRFSPDTDDGYTRTSFNDGEIMGAEMSLGIQHNETTDISFIAAHEFGHALGLDGHSNRRGDIMYPVHWMGTRGTVTARDLATLATLYPDMPGSSKPQAIASE